jgi:hypothetical protein
MVDVSRFVDGSDVKVLEFAEAVFGGLFFSIVYAFVSPVLQISRVIVHLLTRLEVWMIERIQGLFIDPLTAVYTGHYSFLGFSQEIGPFALFAGIIVVLAMAYVVAVVVRDG